MRITWSLIGWILLAGSDASHGIECETKFVTTLVGKSVKLTKLFGSCDGSQPPDYWQLKTQVIYPLKHGFLEVSIPYQDWSGRCGKSVPTRYLIYSAVSAGMDVVELQIPGAENNHFVIQVHK